MLDLPTGKILTPQEYRRLKHYCYGTSYLAAIMCCLRNETRSQREEQLFTILSALASSFDDLTDRFPHGDTDTAWQDDPEIFGSTQDPGGLSLHFLHRIYRILPEQDLARFRGYMIRVFKVERAGTQTSGSSTKRNPSLSALACITEEKGGASVLLFRSTLRHSLSNAEENALFLLGGLIQLCDDIFDLWHDHHAGIATTATYHAEQVQLPQLRTGFEQQVAATVSAFRKLPYPTKQLETTLFIVHYLISITRLCLDHYCFLEQKHGALPLENRTLIVVDMQKWPNRFKVIRYLFQVLE